MSTVETNKRLEELFKNEAFLKGIENLKTREDFRKYLSDNGAEVSAEEIDVVCDTLAAQGNGEMSEDELAGVSGGALGTIALIGLIAGSVSAGWKAAEAVKKLFK